MKRNLASRISRLVSGCCLVAGLGLACGITTGDNSETHFLGSCSDSCRPGLECICGVCTQACTESSACADLHPAAQCANSCSDTPDARICDVPCTDDASCSTLGTNFECAAGRCRQAGALGSGGSFSVGGGAGGSNQGGEAGRAAGGQGGVRPSGGTGPAGGKAGAGGVPPSGGSGNTAGSSSGPPIAPLTPVDGRVDDSSNPLGIQGDIFAFADSTSAVGMTENFAASNACITGTAAKVDLGCTPVPPAEDCYGTTWGAAIGFNLNQPIDPFTGLGVIPPLEYDASALRGFAFEISGAGVPTSLRFRVDTPTGEYCSPPAKVITPGANTVFFSDLQTECWTTGGESGEAAKPNVVRIIWQVVTNTNSGVPFDFCVSNIGAVR